MSVPHSTQHEAETDHAAADDHAGGEDGFSRQRRIILAVQHHCDDDRNLDRRDRQGQDERTVGFADAMGDRLRVMKHREDGREHQSYGHRADGDPDRNGLRLRRDDACVEECAKQQRTDRQDVAGHEPPIEDHVSVCRRRGPHGP